MTAKGATIKMGLMVGEANHQTNNSSNNSNEDQVNLLVAETPKGGNNNIVEDIGDEEMNDLQEIDP